MQRVLIVDQSQFGYFTDGYKWAQYLLEEHYLVSYLCCEEKKAKIHLEQVKVRYSPFIFNKYASRILWLLCCIINIAKFNGIIILVNFRYVGLLTFLQRKKKILYDIRTLCVSPNAKQRLQRDNEVFRNVRKFHYCSVISKELRSMIQSLNPNTYLLPLGADALTNVRHEYSQLHLLYVGTLTNRHIEKTIDGIKLFIDKHPNIVLTYDIVGGSISEEEGLVKHVKESGLDSYIKVHGYIPQVNLKPFFDSCNVGVSFVPRCSYFDSQPPTKTYEYILSGLFCVGTRTRANAEIINDKNGILIEDTPESFAEGIWTVYQKRFEINEHDIRESLLNYQWKYIVRDYLIPILKDISMR